MSATSTGLTKDVAAEARPKYVDQALSSVNTDQLAPLKIVTNSRNGTAGPTVDAIINRLAAQRAPIEFTRVHHNSDSMFPNRVPIP